MSEVRHTPGPWKAFIINDLVVVAPLAAQYSSDAPLAQMKTPFSWEGGNVYTDKDVRKLHIANARLMSKAPDLLEALRPFARFECGCGECNNCIAKSLIDSIERAE